MNVGGAEGEGGAGKKKGLATQQLLSRHDFKVGHPPHIAMTPLRKKRKGGAMRSEPCHASLGSPMQKQSRRLGKP